MKERIIYIISEVEKSHHLEWLTLQIKNHFDLRVILIGKAKTIHEKFLIEQNIPVFWFPYESKADLFSLIVKVYQLLKVERPRLIHTHFWLANIVGIPLSFLLGTPNRVMTRHHGNFHHLFYRKGVWMDILLNRLSTCIISPTEGIRNLMVKFEYVKSAKIKVINHGIDEKYYGAATLARIETLFKKYKIPKAYPIIGVISRHIEWKGIQYIIPAFEEVIKKIPSAHLVLANANGEYKDVINSMLSKMPEGSYTLIEYENDAAALYAIFDVFVHVPIDLYSESFGLIYIEALAAGKPSVFTLSGVAPDFIRHEYNALIVDYKNVGQISSSIMKFVSDEHFARKIVQNGRLSIGKYSADSMGQLMRDLYSRQLRKPIKESK